MRILHPGDEGFRGQQAVEQIAGDAELAEDIGVVLVFVRVVEDRDSPDPGKRRPYALGANLQADAGAVDGRVAEVERSELGAERVAVGGVDAGEAAGGVVEPGFLIDGAGQRIVEFAGGAGDGGRPPALAPASRRRR